MENIITSSQNEKIKKIIKLQKAHERKKQNIIIIEGEREIKMALDSGIEILDFYYCPEIIGGAKTPAWLPIETNIVSELVFQKIAYKENPDGFLALARPKYLTPEEIKLSKNPIIIILEAVEKPGNLGAILRTAHAAGVDAVIINDTQTDIYNPNVIRASMGHIFSKQTVVMSIAETIKWLKSNKIKALATTITAKKFYHQVDLSVPFAIIMGTEKFGISAKWLDEIKTEIKIPMKDNIDSLNVSVSTAIIIYEGQRQRDFVDF